MLVDWGAVGVLIAKAYEVLEDLITGLLASTLFNAKPELANQFGGPLSLLVSLTALYLLVTFVTAAKRIIGAILAIGWALLILAISLTATFST